MYNIGRYLLYFIIFILGIVFAYYLNEKIDSYIIDDNYETYRFKSLDWLYNIFYCYKQGHYEPTIINDLFTILSGLFISYSFIKMLNKVFLNKI